MTERSKARQGVVFGRDRISVCVSKQYRSESTAKTTGNTVTENNNRDRPTQSFHNFSYSKCDSGPHKSSDTENNHYHKNQRPQSNTSRSIHDFSYGKDVNSSNSSSTMDGNSGGSSRSSGQRHPRKQATDSVYIDSSMQNDWDNQRDIRLISSDTSVVHPLHVNTRSDTNISTTRSPSHRSTGTRDNANFGQSPNIRSNLYNPDQHENGNGRSTHPGRLISSNSGNNQSVIKVLADPSTMTSNNHTTVYVTTPGGPDTNPSNTNYRNGVLATTTTGVAPVNGSLVTSNSSAIPSSSISYYVSSADTSNGNAINTRRANDMLPSCLSSPVTDSPQTRIKYAITSESVSRFTVPSSSQTETNNGSQTVQSVGLTSMSSCLTAPVSSGEFVTPGNNVESMIPAIKPENCNIANSTQDTRQIPSSNDSTTKSSSGTSKMMSASYINVPDVIPEEDVEYQAFTGDAEAFVASLITSSQTLIDDLHAFEATYNPSVLLQSGNFGNKSNIVKEAPQTTVAADIGQSGLQSIATISNDLDSQLPYRSDGNVALGGERILMDDNAM